MSIGNYFDKIASEYRRTPFVDRKAIRPYLENIVSEASSPALKEQCAQHFEALVSTLETSESEAAIAGASYVLGFCLSRLRGFNLEARLKSAFAIAINVNARLEIEFLVKRIYDPDWCEGDVDFLDDTFDRWQ